jgi:hypothetical protein
MVQTKYRDIQNYDSWPKCVTRVADIPFDCSCISFYRERNSHRGISAHTQIRKLSAKQVNQEFLEEICELKDLKYLEMETVTAETLELLQRLSHLKTLKLNSVRRASDFGALLKLPSLTKLFIQNAKLLNSLDPFSSAHQMISLGFEGGMWSPQKILSLRPLGKLASLEALFLTSVRLSDKDLSYLATIPNLKVLECARFAPKTEFEKLRRLMPDLHCHWCDKYEIELP